MNTEALWWLALNILTLVIMAYFSMVEMAAVSFNQVRLQYYVSKEDRRAIWLNHLLSNPSRLFGTTLIGVNVTMMIGSECSRQFYSALGYVPEIAPLTQILIVITIGELAPMFAARRYPQHVSMLGIAPLYASAWLMKPLLIGIDLITRAVTWIVRGTYHDSEEIFIGRDELQKLLEQQDDHIHPASGTEDFNIIVSHIFALREKTALQAMDPINPLHMIPTNCTVGYMRHILKNSALSYLPVYHRNHSNIVGIAFPRDLIRVPSSESVNNYARPPWFVTQSAKIVDILRQFRRNNQTAAIVLDAKGKAIGMLSLDAILEEIFGKVESRIAHQAYEPHRDHRVIERTVTGDMKVSDFIDEFGVEVDAQEVENLSQLLAKILGHIPEAGESVYIAPLRLTVKDTSLLGAKNITVTLQR